MRDPAISRDEAEIARDVLLYGGRACYKARSGQWRKVREDFLVKYPTCAVCGGTAYLEVHHILPYHLFPEKELDLRNLITLCARGPMGMSCHGAVGHGGNWVDYVPAVRALARTLRRTLDARVKG